MEAEILAVMKKFDWDRMTATRHVEQRHRLLRRR